MSAQNWGCCLQEIEDEECVKCCQCKTKYHLMCISAIMPSEITSARDLPSTWKCSNCKKPNRGNNDDLPVHVSEKITQRPHKRPAVTSPPDLSSTMDYHADEIHSQVKEVCLSELETLFLRFEGRMKNIISRELAPIQQDIKELQASLGFISEKYEEICTKQELIDNEIDILKTENLKLHADNADLALRIEQLEQQSRSNNIEIQCVPEKKNENLLNIIRDISKTVNYELKEESVAKFSRVARRNADKARPRSIIVQFNSPRVRNAFLAAVISFNKSNQKEKLNTKHIGLAGSKEPIYVMEHLSPKNKSLHAAARTRAKNEGFKFIWVRDGRIFMRKSETSRIILIKDLKSLEKLE